MEHASGVPEGAALASPPGRLAASVLRSSQQPLACDGRGEVGNRGLLEIPADCTADWLERVVQRAEHVVGALSEPGRTRVQLPRAVGRCFDVQKGDCRWRAREPVATSRSLYRSEDAGADETLKNLGSEWRGDLLGGRNIFELYECVRRRGQVCRRSNRVLTRAGPQHRRGSAPGVTVARHVL